MIENCRKNMDKGGIYIALRIDLSKAFNCIVHYFFTAKLEVQSFFVKSLKLCTITSNTENTKLKSIILSIILLIYLQVPQQVQFHSLLFLRFASSFFPRQEKMTRASYTDDTTPYSNADSVVNFIEDIETKEKI